MAKQFLLVRGADLSGGNFSAFHGPEQGRNPFLTAEHDSQHFGPQQGAVTAPAAEQNSGDALATASPQTGEGGLLNRHWLLWPQQFAQAFNLLALRVEP